MRTHRSLGAILVAVLCTGLLAAPIDASRDPDPMSRPSDTSAALVSGQVQLQAVSGGLVAPLGIANAGDGSGRLFIVEKRGTVRVLSGGALQPDFFLDLRDVTGGLTTDGDRGLLGVAFHPSFASNRKLFAFYSDAGGDIVIAELTANPDGLSVPSTTADPLLTIEHTEYDSHYGGHLMFGPDGHLYAFIGDGGDGNDPYEAGQDPTTLLGKVLRIAPDLNGGYSNPAGNPFIGIDGQDEIWAIGLRNPWRASFDSMSGAMWIADVGQMSWEEVNRDVSNAPGRNWGWDCREGAHEFETAGCEGLSFTDPVAEYGHTDGNCSVTGGHVYRGSVFPDFVGQYVLGDFCSGRMWTLDSAADLPSLQLHRDTGALISSFGEGEDGEIYMTDLTGVVYRVVAPPFVDVASSAFIDDITWLFYRGITTGCSTAMFCPSASVSREQMASFIARAIPLPPTSTDFFTDDESSVHEPAINAIAQDGITLGCGPNLYCPHGPVTREQMASFLVRALDLPPTSTDFFTDDESSVHESDINALAAAGITTGCGAGLSCPAGLVTREQMAAFLHRALD